MNDVKDSAEFYRNLWAGAEARLTESQAEVALLRAALDCSSKVFGSIRAGSNDATAVVQASNALDVVCAALEPIR